MTPFSITSIHSRVTLIILGMCFTFILADVYMLQREYALQQALNADMSQNATINQIARNATSQAYHTQNIALQANQVKSREQLDLLSDYLEEVSTVSRSFDMYMNVLKYGTSSEVFRSLDDGAVYERWRQSDFTGSFIVDKAPQELANYAVEAELYFSVYRNYAEKAITAKKQVITMALRDMTIAVDVNNARAEEAFARAGEYSRLTTETLEDLILVNDELNRKLQDSLTEQTKQKMMTSTLLYIAATIISILFGMLLARKLIINPVVSLSNWIQSRNMANLTVPPVTANTDELNLLVDSFTSMATRMKQTAVSKFFVDDIINTMNEYLVLFDTEGNIVRASDKFCSALDYSHHSIGSLSISTVLEDEALVEEIISSTMKGVNISQRETVFIGNDGVRLPVLLSSSMVATENASEYLIVCVATDYTELLESRRMLEEHRDKLDEIIAEKTKALSNALTLAAQAAENAEIANQSKSMFLANMSHELRTPMHAILNYTEMSIDDLKQGDYSSLERYLGNIHTSSDRMLHLLNDLLDLSKLEADRMHIELYRNDLLALLRQCADELYSLCRDKHLSIQINTQLDDAVARIDRDKIHQVVINLLSNAIKFSPEDSFILIDIESAIISVADMTGQAGYRIRVKDQGVGIPQDELSAVFDKFYQSTKTRTHAGGTGLGLAVSKLIVEAHNGRIWAQSNADGGACFTVELPAMLEEKVGTPTSTRAA